MCKECFGVNGWECRVWRWTGGDLCRRAVEVKTQARSKVKYLLIFFLNLPGCLGDSILQKQTNEQNPICHIAEKLQINLQLILFTEQQGQWKTRAQSDGEAEEGNIQVEVVKQNHQDGKGQN